MGLNSFNRMRARLAAEEEAKRKSLEASSKEQPSSDAPKPRKKKADAEKSKKE